MTARAELSRDDAGTRRVRLYGWSVATDLDLDPRLPAASLSPDLRVLRRKPSPVTGEPVYESSFTLPSGAPVLRIHRCADRDVLTFPQLARFELETRAEPGTPRRIAYRPQPGADPRMLEIRFLGTVMAYALELSGIAALHASAVELGGRAVAFLAASGSGKTGLALSLLERGARLLSDDILALDALGDAFSARPSYPSLRLWPELAARYVDDVERLPRLNDLVDKRWAAPDELGFAFAPEPVPLAAIYLPERGASELSIATVRPAEALIELLRQSFLHRMPAALGWEGRRLETLGRLAESVPVRRLRYPSGWSDLPAVVDAVLGELDLEPG